MWRVEKHLYFEKDKRQEKEKVINGTRQHDTGQEMKLKGRVKVGTLAW